MGAMTDAPLVAALAGYGAEGRAAVREDARLDAEASSRAGELGLAAVWRAVADLTLEVDAAAAQDRVAELAGRAAVARAVAACSPRARWMLLDTTVHRRDVEAARPGRSWVAGWWAELAAHTDAVRAEEAATLRRLEDDLLGVPRVPRVSGEQSPGAAL